MLRFAWVWEGENVGCDFFQWFLTAEAFYGKSRLDVKQCCAHCALRMRNFAFRVCVEICLVLRRRNVGCEDGNHVSSQRLMSQPSLRVPRAGTWLTVHRSLQVLRISASCSCPMLCLVSVSCLSWRFGWYFECESLGVVHVMLHQLHTWRKYSFGMPHVFACFFGTRSWCMIACFLSRVSVLYCVLSSWIGFAVPDLHYFIQAFCFYWNCWMALIFSLETPNRFSHCWRVLRTLLPAFRPGVSQFCRHWVVATEGGEWHKSSFGIEHGSFNRHPTCGILMLDFSPVEKSFAEPARTARSARKWLVEKVPRRVLLFAPVVVLRQKWARHRCRVGTVQLSIVRDKTDGF